MKRLRTLIAVMMACIMMGSSLALPVAADADAWDNELWNIEETAGLWSGESDDAGDGDTAEDLYGDIGDTWHEESGTGGYEDAGEDRYEDAGPSEEDGAWGAPYDEEDISAGEMSFWSDDSEDMETWSDPGSSEGTALYAMTDEKGTDYRYTAEAVVDASSVRILSDLGLTTWPLSGLSISLTALGDDGDVHMGDVLGATVTGVDGTAALELASSVPLAAAPAGPYPAEAATLETTEQISQEADEETGVTYTAYRQTITATPQTFTTSVTGTEGATYSVSIRDAIPDYNGETVIAAGTLVGTYTLASPADSLSHLPAFVYGRPVVYEAQETSVPYGYEGDGVSHAFSMASPEVTFSDTDLPAHHVLVEAAGRQLASFSAQTGLVWQDMPLAGAVYGIYAAEDITGPDGSVLYPADTLIEEMTTDAEGKARSTADLCYGSVYIMEGSVPACVQPSPIQRMDAVFGSDGTAAMSFPRHEAVTVSLALTVPKDLSGSRYALKAASDIVSADGSVIAGKGTQLTKGTIGEEGVVISSLPTDFYGDVPMYDASLTVVPFGYQPDAAAHSAGGTADEVLALSAVSRASHTVTVISEGSVLVGYAEGAFVFEDRPLEGSVYGVYAAEDIRNGSGAVIYAKDELIEKVTTDGTGKAVTREDLLFGNVYVKELSLPFGLKVSGEAVEAAFGDDGTAEVSFKGAGQTTITVTGTGTADISGMTVALQANTDIVSSDGTLLVRAGEVLSRKVLANGQCVFTGLPMTSYGTAPMYNVIETAAPAGYYVDGQVYMVAGDKDETVALGVVPQELTINVTDSEGKTLSGAVLSLADADGKVLKTWTSGGQDLVTALPEGTYKLTQVHPSPGYAISDPIMFTITSQSHTVTVEEMKNTVTVSLSDATDGAPIPGAVLYVKNEAGRLVKTITTTKKPAVITGLAAGIYTVSQKETTDGYQAAEPVSFIVKETDTAVSAALTNARTFGYIRITLVSSINRDPLEGGTYVLYDGEMKAVDQLITDKNGNARSKEFEIGRYEDGKFEGPSTYYLQESQAPEGYNLDSTRYQITLVYLNESTPRVYRQITLPNRQAVSEEARTRTVTTQVGTRTVTAQTGTGTSQTGVRTASASGMATNARTGDMPDLLPLFIFMGLVLIAAGYFSEGRPSRRRW